MSKAKSASDIYSLHETRRVRLHVHYPNDLSQLVLRTDSFRVFACHLDVTRLSDRYVAVSQDALNHRIIYSEPV